MSGRSSDIEVLNHHPARRLGYRRCGLVMQLVPDVDYADVQPPLSGIQPLPTIAGYSPAVDVPGPGNRLAQPSQAPEGGFEHPGILHHRPAGAGGQILNAHVHPHGGSHPWTGGSGSPVSTEKQANQRPAVRLTVTSLMRRPNLRCSTMATRATLGIMTVLPSTFTVSGPLSARSPARAFGALKRGNPRLESRWFDRHRRNQILCQRAGWPAFGDCGHLIISPASSC